MIKKEKSFFIGQEVSINKERTRKEIEDVIKDLDPAKAKRIVELYREMNDLIKAGKLHGKAMVLHDGYLTIDLGHEYSFTSSIEPFNYVFKGKTFITISSDCVEPIGEEKEVSDFSRFINKENSLEKKCLSVKSYIESINSYNKDIKKRKEQIVDMEKSMLEISNVLKLKKKEILEGEEDTSDDVYKGILRNPNIKRVFIDKYDGEDCIAVETNDLEYDGDREYLFEDMRFKDIKFNLGRFIIIITGGGQLRASNITKFLGDSTSNSICISNSSNFCTGSAFGDAVYKAMRDKKYASAIHMTIDFIKNPNSSNPFSHPYMWYFAQDKKKKQDNIINYIGHSPAEGETWDKKLYIKKLNEFKKKYSK
jgi:hypothetical protein